MVDTVKATLFRDVAGLRVTEHEILSVHSTFRVGGPTDVFLVPENEDALRIALERSADAAVPVFILGGGTNVLVADAGFRGVVIHIAQEFDRIAADRERVTVGAGTRLPHLAAWTGRERLAGLESLAGIPGTVGGALSINAGAFGAEFGELVSCVDGFSFKGEPIRFEAAEICFGYREAVYPSPMIFTGAVLTLRPDDPASIQARAAEIRRRRGATQPLREQSAGCAFKNPTGESAGRIIDGLGLKGHCVGGAQVSSLHANYIVNAEGASADDIRRLIDDVRDRVAREAGVQLQTEVRMLGFDS